jgi:hypothetical protein
MAHVTAFCNTLGKYRSFSVHSISEMLQISSMPHKMARLGDWPAKALLGVAEIRPAKALLGVAEIQKVNHSDCIR